MLRTYTIDPNEPVVIRTYRHEYEAELARARLDAADLHCLVLAPAYAEHMGASVRLLVRRADVEEARAILDAPTVAGPEDGPPEQPG